MEFTNLIGVALLRTLSSCRNVQVVNSISARSSRISNHPWTKFKGHITTYSNMVCECHHIALALWLCTVSHIQYQPMWFVISSMGEIPFLVVGVKLTLGYRIREPSTGLTKLNDGSPAVIVKTCSLVFDSKFRGGPGCPRRITTSRLIH